MNVIIVDSWNSYLSELPDEKKDLYYTEEYIGLYKTEIDKPQCIVCKDCKRVLLIPFLRHEIREYFDFETAYGYGGPITNCSDSDWIETALDQIRKKLIEEDFICGFLRFHPLLNNQLLYKHNNASYNNHCQVLYDRQTVAIDTFVDKDAIWNKQITSKNRNMIRKAEKNDLVYKTEFDFASIDEFKALYSETMKRLEADSFYFFCDKYFSDFITNMRDKAFLGTIRKDGKLICAALFMYSKYYGHYHLEGSDRQYSSLGANNLLLWKAACEMHSLGVKEFHLGGGTMSSPDDSLFKFKKAFSGNLKEFYIGKEIFNAPVYAAICDEWEKRNINKAEIYGNRLLKYRY